MLVLTMVKSQMVRYLYIPGFFLLVTYTQIVMSAPKGEQVYEQSCIVCHADDGSGAMPGVTDLSTNREWSNLKDAQLLTLLKNGIQKPGATVIMPPLGGNPDLSEDDLKAVISFMRNTFIK